MVTFTEKKIHTWQDFLNIRERFTHKWVFRGQSSDWNLKTTLERASEDSGIDPRNIPDIERQLIREFRRRYDGNDRDIVLDDTLYCLALMQHHGAPTRLLDWTYSPFIAAYFALERSSTVQVVWCINGSWCEKEVVIMLGENIVRGRNIDESRNDTTFIPLYMGTNQRKFIFIENPFLFNRRSVIQQGVFLVPGDVSVSFEYNLKHLKGWDEESSVVKLCFED